MAGRAEECKGEASSWKYPIYPFVQFRTVLARGSTSGSGLGARRYNASMSFAVLSCRLLEI
jgi:hypothetical protein